MFSYIGLMVGTVYERVLVYQIADEVPRDVKRALSMRYGKWLSALYVGLFTIGGFLAVGIFGLSTVGKVELPFGLSYILLGIGVVMAVTANAFVVPKIRKHEALQKAIVENYTKCRQYALSEKDKVFEEILPKWLVAKHLFVNGVDHSTPLLRKALSQYFDEAAEARTDYIFHEPDPAKHPEADRIEAQYNYDIALIALAEKHKAVFERELGLSLDNDFAERKVYRLSQYQGSMRQLHESIDNDLRAARAALNALPPLKQ